MPQARKWKMRARYPKRLFARQRQDVAPGSDSLLRVDIELDGNLGSGELYRMAVDDVPPHQQFPFGRGKQIAAMPGRVSGQWMGVYAWQQGIAGIELFKLAGSDIRRDGLLRGLEERLQRLGGFRRDVGV